MQHDFRGVYAHNQTLAGKPLVDALDPNPRPKSYFQHFITGADIEKIRNVVCDPSLALASHDPSTDATKKARRYTEGLPAELPAKFVYKPHGLSTPSTGFKQSRHW